LKLLGAGVFVTAGFPKELFESLFFKEESFAQENTSGTQNVSM
jgi:hypothetical protein